MKRLILLLTLGVLVAPLSEATQILRWQRLPLAVSLIVGQERIIFFDRNKTLRIGVPAGVAERLRVQSAGGAIYLRASAPIDPVRLQLQDARSGEVILLDVTAQPAVANEPALESLQIIDGDRDDRHERGDSTGPSSVGAIDAAKASPVPVVLIRFAAQSLYAPLRTVEPLAGISAIPLRRDLALDSLLPTLPVHAQALAAWRLDDYWVTAVKITHTRQGWLTLDPRALQGDFIAASFQHPNLGPAGDATDTTVAYLVTRGSGLAEAVLPAISRIDASLNTRNAPRSNKKPSP